MDPASLIAGAVAAGAAAALKDTASQAVKDAYSGLVTLIKDYYKAHSDIADSVEYLAKKPQDEGRRAGLEGELKTAALEDGQQMQLVVQANEVLAAVEMDAPESARSAGVNIPVLRAEAGIWIEGVRATGRGTVVSIGDATTKGFAVIKDVQGTFDPKE